jgi:hypothetical protein
LFLARIVIEEWNQRIGYFCSCWIEARLLGDQLANRIAANSAARLVFDDQI